MGGESNWDVKPAQIYSTLTRLLDSDLIAEETSGPRSDEPDRRVYAITEKGKTELAEWFDTPVERAHQRDEVFAKLMLALTTHGIDPHHIIQTQRARLYQQLHALTAQRNQVDPKTHLAHVLLLDSAVMHIEADLHWLEMVDARLDEIERQPLPRPELRPRGRPPKEKKEQLKHSN